jgi:transcriptional regulator with XRE-family HTH domain
MADRTTRRAPIPVRRGIRDFAEHVQTWRKLAGLTQEQLADRAGLNRKTIARVEQGDGAVSSENLLRIMHALGFLDRVVRAADPYETDVGRLRADEQLPRRVRPRDLRRDDG